MTCGSKRASCNFPAEANIVLLAAAISHVAAKGQVVFFLPKANIVVLLQLYELTSHVAAKGQVVLFLPRANMLLPAAAISHVAAKVHVRVSNEDILFGKTTREAW